MKDDDNDDDNRCEIRSGRLRGPSPSYPREITSRVSEFKNLDTHANQEYLPYTFYFQSYWVWQKYDNMTIFCNLFVG